MRDRSALRWLFICFLRLRSTAMCVIRWLSTSSLFFPGLALFLFLFSLPKLPPFHLAAAEASPATATPSGYCSSFVSDFTGEWDSEACVMQLSSSTAGRSWCCRRRNVAGGGGGDGDWGERGSTPSI